MKTASGMYDASQHQPDNKNHATLKHLVRGGQVSDCLHRLNDID